MKFKVFPPSTLTTGKVNLHYHPQKKERDMRQAKPTFKLSAVLLACGALLSACGGGGGDTSANSGGKLQTITFPYAGKVATLGVGTVTLSATASSGLPVTYSSQTPSVCTVSGNQLTVLKAGSECSVVANQDGGTDANGVNWAAADKLSQVFVVTKTTQTVQFAKLPAYVLTSKTTTLPLAATASSGMPITFTAEPTTVCSIQGGNLVVLGKGACTVKAEQPGDAGYFGIASQQVVAVDPFIVADGFDPASVGTGRGTNSTTRTTLGGAVAVNGFSRNIMPNPGPWGNCPETAGDWCHHEVSADGTVLTSTVNMRTAIFYTQWWDYSGNWVDVFAPGVTGLNWTSDTPGGMQVTTETVLGFSAGVNAELAAQGKNLVVQLVLGKSDGNGCNVTMSTVVYPSGPGLLSYGVSLSNFALTDACGVAGVTATSLDNNVRKLPNYNDADPAVAATKMAAFVKALNDLKPARDSAATLLQTYPVVQVRVRSMDLQYAATVKDANGADYWPNELKVGSFIGMQ